MHGAIARRANDPTAAHVSAPLLNWNSRGERVQKKKTEVGTQLFLILEKTVFRPRFPVNMHKGDFLFAAANLIPDLMAAFERDYLSNYSPCEGFDESKLIDALAICHVELIIIHPFREGNGCLSCINRGQTMVFILLTINRVLSLILPGRYP
jgi:hypothetical protein